MRTDVKSGCYALALLASISGQVLAAAEDVPLFSKATNDSLLWGPYRPNLYFGVRPRQPSSLIAGLLWGRVDDFNHIQQNIRYTCEQGDNMQGYGWDAYDPRTGGVQTMHDKGNGIDLETSFVKLGHGWGARIKGTVREDADSGQSLKTSVWLNTGLEGLGSMQVQNTEDYEDMGFDGDVVIKGDTSNLGDFTVTISEPKDKNSHPTNAHPAYQKKPLDRTFVHSLQVPAEAVWQAKPLTFASMKTTIDAYLKEYTQDKMPPPSQIYTIQNQPGAGNYHVIQKVYEGDFEFDVFYTPANAGSVLTHADLDAKIAEVRKSFDEKYGETLAPKKPFADKEHLRFGQSLFSNLIGGIGYFYGEQMIDRSYASEYDEENEGFWTEAADARARNAQELEGPYELYTSVPSRPFFPRGFLWDEGFHLLPIVDWDPEVAMQIVQSYFHTMDEDGWIPREQILGSEARSKVPAEFQVQYPHYANPPTLFMVLEALLDKASTQPGSDASTGQQVLGNSGLAEPETFKAWLKQLYPLLQCNFNWYRKTQSGDMKSYDRPEPLFNPREAYRWRGRTPQHILTSGLDDYPRAQPPHPGELHVDLMSWMGMMTRSLKRVAAFLGEDEDKAKYAKIEEAIRRNTDDLHWSKKDKAYCDLTTDDYEDTVHVCHKGYVSLFPFLTGLMDPDHPHMKDVLDLIANEDELWSPFGIRSLSKQDALYGTEENYWRSPVWMPINYLVLTNLLKISRQEGPQQQRAGKMYSALRTNLVRTVFDSWRETGFAWEQYDPETGQGQRTAHFTGWTALVVKVMNLPEADAKGRVRDELKFGKHIQKRQLDIPEYAASFVDYKALKKLIKKLSTTPIIPSQEEAGAGETDPQKALQANKATFFFRLERELEKVNTFYLQKEAELKLRLRTLLDKKHSLQGSTTPASKLSSSYVTLDEGFRLFSNDLDKLQQFVEVNQTAFSKILKKWDKTSKSRTKELYLSRAVDVQPCFNRDVISDLSDQATTGLLELQAWAEGEKISYTPAVELENRPPSAGPSASEIEGQIVQAVNAGSINLVKEWISRAVTREDSRERMSRLFLNTVNTAPANIQEFMITSGSVDFNYADQINERNCMHEASVSGGISVLKAALVAGANIRAQDVYGRIPLHYACMHGRAEAVQILVAAAPDTVDAKDLDHFTPLIHSIVHDQATTSQMMLELGATVNPKSGSEHIPLNLACQYGSAPIIEQMLRYRPQILPDAEGLFPQHLVARFGGNPAILQMLKNYGVNMDQQDKLYQWTPIFHAASEGHLRCLQALLNFRVNASIKDEKGLTSMYYAAWEGHLDCMQLLAHEGVATGMASRSSADVVMSAPLPLPLQSGALDTGMQDPDAIPSLSLPPPIIPLRRYGHNFLETTKTFILLSFDNLGCDAIEFYGDSKYPAARLTISSKSSDLIPRNVPLPVQDDFKNISFQIENLDAFSIDFDIFPTFGSKVIARAAASSRVFTGKRNSSGRWHLELFDPRLRAIGRISFRFQVVTPFHGIPLEITHFATYWKATTQDDNHPSNLITGSSLSGDFKRLFIQVTKDGVPVLYNRWALPSSKNDLVSRMTYAELEGSRGAQVQAFVEHLRSDRPRQSSDSIRKIASSQARLDDVLAVLPADVNLELHICYPTKAEEEAFNLAPTQNMNLVVDAVLTSVFEHARRLREMKDSPLRSFVFSSYNADICTALNWKQPNYPVLLCNELGAITPPEQTEGVAKAAMVSSCGRTNMSIKESVRIAQSNNFMGLVCSSRLLDLVPALIQSVKEAGLVLISDYSTASRAEQALELTDLAKGVDGMLLDNSVLRFRDTVDQ